MHRLMLVIAMMIAAPAAAQHSHSAHANKTGTPQETGQSAFAAVAEIVEILRSDPETDWSRVDIDGLRRHLVDMDLLTTQAVVLRKVSTGGTRFEVRGGQRTLQAIRAMVPAHAPFLAAETGWNVTTENLVDGIALIVEGDQSQIEALGFFGLMAIGAHHQRHHLMMAKGLSTH